MSLGRLFATSCVAAAMLATSAQAAGPYGSIRVAGWAGGAFADDDGRFAFCAAAAPYVSGITFMVVASPSGNWALNFAHNDWNLSPDDVFPIELVFDGQARFNLFGKVLKPHHVTVPMPNNSALMTQFRKASQMAAVARGRLFQFNLTGTAQLMPSLQNCVATVKAKGIAKAGDFTVAPSARAAAATERTAAAPPAPGGSLKAESQPDVAEYQIEALELASNFVLKTALQNPRVLSRAETPTALASGAAWQSDEATGFVRIIPSKAGTKGLDVTAAVIAADARECKGRFASARKSELIDSDVVFEGMVSCEDSGGIRLAHYFLVPRTKGGFVMFSVISNMKTESAKNVTKEDRLGGFRKAALVVVSR